MKTYLAAAILIAGIATPAFAVETFFIMLDNTMKGRTIMSSQPSDTHRYKADGQIRLEVGRRDRHAFDEGLLIALATA
jgi:hypothetical protein